jgi:hypothetical protein
MIIAVSPYICLNQLILAFRLPVSLRVKRRRELSSDFQMIAKG